MSTKPSKILEFMLLMGKLKATRRTGWVRRGVKHPESIADHMYRMATMSMLIDSQTGLAKDKCIKLALVHDMAECITGDITPFDGVSKEEKHSREEASMKHITTLVSTEVGTEIYNLWLEYESQLSSEAQFVKDLDQFDMILQAYEYETAEQRPNDLNEFFVSTEGKFRHSIVQGWVQELKTIRSSTSDDLKEINLLNTEAVTNDEPRDLDKAEKNTELKTETDKGS